MPIADGVSLHRSPGTNWQLVGAAVATGVAAGIAGIGLSLLLHLVQHLAFGYTEETFLTGVEQATATRRVLALTIGGLIVGTGWWALRRSARTVPSVEQVLADPGRALPSVLVTVDAALQIVAVGAGASLGREGAPRQVGAILGHLLATRMGLTAAQRRTIVACGAGSGLAAVYNVPLGGALFTLEILLSSAALSDVVPALLSSAVATATTWPILSNRPTYAVPTVAMHPALLVWALLIGPFAGAVGLGFVRLIAVARTWTPTGWRLAASIPVTFTVVGAVAIAYPQLLGNGKGPAQLAFDGTLSLLVLGILVALKPLATAVCLAGGASGGLLTPALATGAMFGALAGGAWSLLWPGAAIAAYAIVAAAAVLATTQKAPLCAIVLVLEFTHTGLELAVPTLLAVVGALLTASLLGEFLTTRAGPTVARS